MFTPSVTIPLLLHVTHPRLRRLLGARDAHGGRSVQLALVCGQGKHYAGVVKSFTCVLMLTLLCATGCCAPETAPRGVQPLPSRMHRQALEELRQHYP
jgi:hypothetical protein